MRIAAPRVIRIVLVTAAVALIGAVAFIVLAPFLVPIVWAVILVYITWPAYRGLRATLGGRENLAALIATIGLTAALVLPVVWMVILLQGEAAELYASVEAALDRGFVLPASIERLPIVGAWLQEAVTLLADPQGLRKQAGALVVQWSGNITGLAGNLGRNLAKLAFMLLAAFFFYRDGERFLDAFRRTLLAAVGPRARGYLDTLAVMTRAVVFGMVLTAIAQGLLAAIGYWVAGARAPATLGIVTALLALFPFGAPAVYVPVAIGLMLFSSFWWGLALLAWGALIVSSMDNVIRPLVISGAARIPFLLVVFGALGGIAAFGLLGVFVGPLALALALAVWREWLEGPDGRPGAAGRAGSPGEVTPTPPTLATRDDAARRGPPASTSDRARASARRAPRHRSRPRSHS